MFIHVFTYLTSLTICKNFSKLISKTTCITDNQGWEKPGFQENTDDNIADLVKPT